MASMLISGLIPLLQQPGLMLEMEEECQKLLNLFADIQPNLADAELRAGGEPDVRTWLADLNSAAYDADDIVDDFRYAKLQAAAEAEGYPNRNGDTVRTCFFLFSCFKTSRINQSGVLQGNVNIIVPVVKNIEDLVERMRVLNFRPGHEINITASAERPQQLFFSSPTEIVGRDKEKEAVVNALLKQSDLLLELHIIGPQGIGKTPLVQFACNDARVSNHFEYVVWVEVGLKFNIGKAAKSVIDQVIEKDCCISEGDIDLLRLRLYQELTGKRLILVVDDAGSPNYFLDDQLLVFINQWLQITDGLRSSLVVISNSNILPDNLTLAGDLIYLPEPLMADVTLASDIIYVLEPLMAEYGWNLFCEKAFSDDANETCPEILEEMGKEIMVKCGESPLAVNMMGGLMRFKKGPKEWQGVINQLKKEILNDIGAATVETIIKVCYDNLCSQVKQCFAFCSLFPEGRYMDKEVLIEL